MDSILSAGNKLASKLNRKMDRETTYRTKCELCGRRLEVPETDLRNCAVCNKCMRGQRYG